MSKHILFTRKQIEEFTTKGATLDSGKALTFAELMDAYTKVKAFFNMESLVDFFDIASEEQEHVAYFNSLDEHNQDRLLNIINEYYTEDIDDMPSDWLAESREMAIDSGVCSFQYALKLEELKNV